MPYGTAIGAGITGNNRRFTSYDRSTTTKLDYAVNRSYNAGLGRFTQVDPIGMGATSLSDPQSLNLYAYCGNDPINQTDPSGLFSWKSFFKILGIVLIIVAIVVAVIALAPLIHGISGLIVGLEEGGTIGMSLSTKLAIAGGLAAAVSIFASQKIKNRPKLKPRQIRRTKPPNQGGEGGAGATAGSAAGISAAVLQIPDSFTTCRPNWGQLQALYNQLLEPLDARYGQFANGDWGVNYISKSYKGTIDLLGANGWSRFYGNIRVVAMFRINRLT